MPGLQELCWMVQQSELSLNVKLMNEAGVILNSLINFNFKWKL